MCTKIKRSGRAKSANDILCPSVSAAERTGAKHCSSSECDSMLILRHTHATSFTCHYSAASETAFIVSVTASTVSFTEDAALP